MDKIQTGLVSLSVGLLLIIIQMFGRLHDDVISLKKDGERRDHDIQSVQIGTNELRLGQYDMNGRLKTVEAMLQESHSPNKKPKL